MTYEDPFNQAPVDNTPAPEPTPAPVAQAPVTNQVAVASAPGDLSVTFKGDGGFSAPWIVPKYATVADALIDLGEDPSVVAGMSQAQLWMALFERATKMAAHYASLGGGAPQSGGGGGQQQRQGRAPQGAKEPPAWFPPKPYPDFVYRTGTTSKGRNVGKTWHAWMPPQKDDPQGREPEFHDEPK